MVDLSNYHPDRIRLQIGRKTLIDVEKTPMDTITWLKILHLKELNRNMCARRKLLIQWLEEDIRSIFRSRGNHDDWYKAYQKRQCEVFSLNVQIEANGREVLRLRGGKWSV